MAALADTNRPPKRRLMHCKKQRARATSSYPFIASRQARRSLQPSTRRTSAPQHSMFWRRRSSGLVVGLLWIERRRCAYHPYISGPNGGGRRLYCLWTASRRIVFRDLHARQLVQLLRGIKVADIPVQQASFEARSAPRSYPTNGSETKKAPGGQAEAEL